MDAWVYKWRDDILSPKNVANTLLNIPLRVQNAKPITWIRTARSKESRQKHKCKLVFTELDENTDLSKHKLCLSVLYNATQ